MIPAVSAATGSETGLAYQWIAVADGGALYTSTSTTASSWTSRTSSFGSTGINNVASNALNLYVAVGASAKLATSPDGITWTQRTSGAASGTSINNVAYGNGYWVAVGCQVIPSTVTYVAYSTDGITWTSNTTGISGNPNFRTVEYGNGVWAIGASNGTFYTATSPTGTWTSRTTNITASIKNNGLLYAKSQSIWVLGANGSTSNSLRSSTDATTWTTRAANYPDGGVLTGAFASNTSVIVYGDREGGATTNQIYSSTNGTTWTQRTPATTTGYLAAAASDATGTIAFMSDAGRIQTSTDGTTWTDRGTIASATWYGLCHSSGRPALR